MKEKPEYDISKIMEVSVPSNFGITPFFAASPQAEMRVVQLPNGAMWQQGVDNPYATIKVEPQYMHGLDVNHAHVFFALLAYYRANEKKYHVPVHLTYNAIIKLGGWSKSNKSFNRIKQILGDLSNVWTAFYVNARSKPIYFKLLGDFKMDYGEYNINSIRAITFDASFIRYVQIWERTLLIQLEAWNKMSSKIARALYLYLPSRAFHHTDPKDPFMIALPLVLAEVSISVSIKYAKQIMTQHTNSVMKQLDHAHLQHNRKLRVKIEDNILLVWTEMQATAEPRPRKLGQSSLLAWFIAGGNGTEKEYYEIISNSPELNSYELHALEFMGIDVNDHKEFLQMSKALLSEFSSIVGEAKIQAASKPITIFYLIGLIRRQLTGDLFAMNEELM